ncbi:hypothetical protein G5I_07546 [Acromyrmex echinatior]|uniref:Uncharacterized protein n=1 Tax=Acromyrmex echinatior TaxID=103372 RepID=F4WP36_ACREC|nr:hypothetical protein G5I_07546 [Acromyrmex echinatior]
MIRGRRILVEREQNAHEEIAVGCRDSNHKFGPASNGMARIDEQGGRRHAETFPPSETPEEEDQEDSWYRRSVDKRNRLAQSKYSRKRFPKNGRDDATSQRPSRSSGLTRLCAVEIDSRGRERSALRSRSPGSSGSSGNLCPQPARRADAISFVRKQRECEKTECRAAEQVPRFPEADRRRRRCGDNGGWRRCSGGGGVVHREAQLCKPRARTTIATTTITTVTTTSSPPLPPSSSPRIRANHIERTCRN